MSFKITYSFVAEDKFTAVAKRIASAAKNIDEQVQKANVKLCGLDKELNKVNVSSKKASDKINAVSSKISVAAKKAESGASSFSTLGQRIHFATQKTIDFGERLTRVSDFFGMAAYYQFMNVAFPMAIIAKLGMDYADSIESARISMNALFANTKGYAAFQRQLNSMAKTYEATTRFSAAQVMNIASVVANMTGNIEATKRIIPVVLKYALATGQTKNLGAAAQQFLQGVIGGRLPRINMLLTGGSAYERLNQALKQLDKRYKGVLIADSKTASAQLARLSNRLNHVFGIIMMKLGPAFKFYGDMFNKYFPAIQKFIKAHSALMIILGKAAIGGLVFLGVLMALGVIIGIISMPFQALNAILKTTTVLMGILRLETLPFTLIVGALGIALYFLIKHFKTFKMIAVSAFDKVASRVKAVYDYVVKIIDKIIEFRNKIRSVVAGFGKHIGGDVSHGTMMMKNFFTGESTEHNVNVHVNIHDKGNNVRSALMDYAGPGHANLNLGRNLYNP